MKILNISNMPVWLWGKGKGIPSIFYPQREFAKKGFEVYFLCPKKEGEPNYSYIEGVHIYRFDFPFNFRKNIYIQNRIKESLLRNLNWLFFQVFGFFHSVKLAKKIKPDIIYAHSLTSAFISYLVSKIFKTKLLIRIYGTRQLYWKYNNFFFRLKEFRDYLSFKIPADYFVITDDGTFGNLVAKKMGVPEVKIRYWRNGIDEDFFREEPQAKEEICKLFGINPSSKIIASTSRLIPCYGVDKLIYSLVHLAKKRKGWVCLICGSGPMEEELKELIKKNNLSEKVFFPGIVDRKTIKNILYASDIFVLLAKYHNCTNTMWEAMATGRCILATKTEAIKEILKDGKEAVLVSPDEFEAIPEVLEELLDNEE
ncbi:MAG TPA: glycosyltransferase family 1 protein, partial [Candidatus Omnitrophica bacterium]|nr:glycosyltransferase family 1 protein [Candidatus Omnitrophota bacterium]